MFPRQGRLCMEDPLLQCPHTPVTCTSISGCVSMCQVRHMNCQRLGPTMTICGFIVQAARAYDVEMVRVLGEAAVLNKPPRSSRGHQQPRAAAAKLRPPQQQQQQAPSPLSAADPGAARPLSAASAASTADLARLIAPAVTPDSTASAAPPSSGAQVWCTTP